MAESIPTSSLLQDCLGPLVMSFRRSSSAYRNYLNHGKTFRWSLVIWRANNDLVSLLIQTGWMLPDTHKDEAIRIVTHLDLWASLWERHKCDMQPTLDDIFVFENSHSFPRDAEEKIIELFTLLSSDCDEEC